MESLRQKKIAKLILKEIVAFFQTQGQGFFKDSLVTVTEVKMSPDLSLARIYLSFLPAEGKDLHLEKAEENIGLIRGFVGNNLRSSIRKIPELNFFHDDTAEYTQRINHILDSLNIPPEEES
jgi:ribosome-binding factor A